MAVLLGELAGVVPGKRIRVVLDQSSGISSIQLHEQHQADGLGWFDQRHVSLDADQVTQFLTLLGQVNTPSCPTRNDTQVLRFPTPIVAPVTNERKQEVV